MSGNSLVLDTNAAVAILNKIPEIAVVAADMGQLLLPLVALGELEYGARKSANRSKNFDSLERLLKEVKLILPDRETAASYGEVYLSLRKKGRPIPTNDVWIAAQAMQYNLPVLTRDAHFHNVDGLDIVGW